MAHPHEASRNGAGSSAPVNMPVLNSANTRVSRMPHQQAVRHPARMKVVLVAPQVLCLRPSRVRAMKTGRRDAERGQHQCPPNARSMSLPVVCSISRRTRK